MTCVLGSILCIFLSFSTPTLVIPDGRGGFVPASNSRYDPRTGQFLENGYPPPIVYPTSPNQIIPIPEDPYTTHPPGYEIPQESPEQYEVPEEDYNESVRPPEPPYEQEPPGSPTEPQERPYAPPSGLPEQRPQGPPPASPGLPERSYAPPTGDELLRPRRAIPPPKHPTTTKGGCYDSRTGAYNGQNNPECKG